MSTFVIIHDQGAGVTELSLQYFKKNVHKLGQIFEIDIDRDRAFHMEIRGAKGVMLLSGCNCGYGGEGPHGSLNVIENICKQQAVFYERDLLRKLIFGNKKLHFKLRNSQLKQTQELADSGKFVLKEQLKPVMACVERIEAVLKGVGLLLNKKGGERDAD